MGTPSWMKLAGPAAAVLPIAIAGCAATTGPAPAAREMSPSEFASAATVAEKPPVTRQRRPIRLGAGPPDGNEAPGGAVSTAPSDARTLEASMLPANRPLEVGEQVMIERMVGQVNGRPIYADEFFEPIVDQLRAEGQGATGPQFAIQAEQIIGTRLQQVVLSELLLAEAETGLTELEQMGLIGWLQGQRESLFAQKGGGSRAQAEERMQETEQISVEEYLQDFRDQELIRNLLGRKVYPRVIVSWRDVQREYERRDRVDHEFNPPPSWTLARIMLSTKSRAEDIEQVKQRLAAGEEFGAVADSVGMPNRGQWGTYTLDQLAESIRLRVEGLEAGQTSEVFQSGRSTAWIHVDAIDRPPGRSVYDIGVQRQLIGYLRSRRFAAEQDRYIQTLLEEGIYDQIGQMQQRLLEMAVRRFGP